MKNSVFWDIMPCSHLKVNRSLRGTYRLHLQGRRINQARNQPESRWQDGGDMFLRNVGPSARRTKDLLRLNRDQLRCVVGLLTGHCHLKGHLFKLGLINDPICERCQEEDESATHILCDCEAVAHIRFHHLGQFFMEPSDYYDAPHR
jgi:hypothetical protein